MTKSAMAEVREISGFGGRSLSVCGWCDSTHIADVTCTCKEPCPRGWCPAEVRGSAGEQVT